MTNQPRGHPEHWDSTHTFLMEFTVEDCESGDYSEAQAKSVLDAVVDRLSEFGTGFYVTIQTMTDDDNEPVSREVRISWEASNWSAERCKRD